MARPREFDESEVLDRALHAFWSKGYEGTSIQDLVGATGLGRASLYGAFGDKEQLYRRVLDRYTERMADLDALAASASSTRVAFETIFKLWIGATCQKSGPRGCFLQLAGTAGGDASFARDALSGSLRHMERLFVEMVKQGQASGELPVDRDPTAIARLLVVVVQGLGTLARAGWGQERLRSAVEQALAHILDAAA